MSDANGSGRTLEEQVASALRVNGIAFSPQFDTGWYSVLGKRIKSDFYLPRPVGFEEGLHIEVRWQDSSGSVDEKICYLKENIVSVYRRPAIVVLEGSQVHAQYEYLRAFRDGSRLLDVHKLGEFIAFANRLRTGDARSMVRDSYDPSQRALFV
jgi:hypothetical protein